MLGTRHAPPPARPRARPPPPPPTPTHPHPPPPTPTHAGCTGRHWGIGSGQTAAQKAALQAELDQLAAALRRHGGPFLLGAQPTLPDVLVYPFLYRYDVGMRGLAGHDLGAAGAWSSAALLLRLGLRCGCCRASGAALSLRSHKLSVSPVKRLLLPLDQAAAPSGGGWTPWRRGRPVPPAQRTRSCCWRRSESTWNWISSVCGWVGWSVSYRL